MQIPTEKLIKKIKSYREDWNLYASEVLNTKLDDDQQEILEAISKNRRVSIRSGHARGKDYVTAIAAICFLTLYKPSKVIVTAPTGRQVDGIMLAEIKKVYKNARVPIGGEVRARGIRMTEDDTWYLIGFKAGDKSGESWTGFHSPNIMVCITEASGLDEETFNAIEGLLQGNSHLVLAFNPIKMTGEAYGSTMSDQYKSFRLNCINAPNVVNWKKVLNGEITKAEYKRRHISGQVDYLWIDEKIRKPGWVTEIPALQDQYDFEWEGKFYRPEDLFRIKVLGEFPEEDEDSLITFQMLEGAYQRYDELTNKDIEKNRDETSLDVGVDIAGMGRDFNVIAERSGLIVEDIKPFQKNNRKDTIHMEVAGKIRNMSQRHRHRKPKFYIDTIGEGAGVYSRLKEQEMDNVFSAKATHASGNLTDRTENIKFVNMRAYMFWKLREAVQDGLAIKRNDYLTEELTKIKYEFDSKGRIKIEEKDKIKERIGRSPDFSDSLALTFYKKANKKVKSNASALTNL